jgi:hypothetical protein
LGAALQADGEYEVRVYGLKHQKEKRSMDHFAGLDVSVKDTNVCIVDDTGKIVREVKVASEPDALLPVLTNAAYCFKRIGLEAGPLSQWLFSALAEADMSAWTCRQLRQGRPKDRSTSSSNPMMEGPMCRFRREARARE